MAAVAMTSFTVSSSLSSPSLLTVLLILLLSIACRYVVGLYGYSGHNRPPMYGDFEAQRHWLEITYNLPIGDWYRNTKSSDLGYWGLDYPPLTAYVSYILGALADICYPEMVKLYDSRGCETYHSKLFMRVSVILCDIIVFIPIVMVLQYAMYNSYSSSDSDRRKHRLQLNFTVSSLFSLQCPSLLLIDHGHFQYNAVSIGLTLISIYYLYVDKDVYSSVFFCLSLNFKQMGLYYSPFFFVFLLCKCYFVSNRWIDRVKHLLKIGSTVIVSFALLWMPFCVFANSEDEETCVSSVLLVLSRQFPFSRGIFEDKVANLWFTLSRFIDYRAFVPLTSLIRFSLILTLLLLSPTMYKIISSARKTAGNSYSKCDLTYLLLCISTCSLAFFLASFQVHEKSLLLLLVPLSLLLEQYPYFIAWLQLLGCWTMFPLLVRDGLRLPYYTLNLAYISYVALVISRSCSSDFRIDQTSPFPLHTTKYIRSTILASSIGMIMMHVAELTVSSSLYPDLYPVLFAVYGCCNLCFAYVVLVAWLLFYCNSCRTTFSHLQ